MAYSNVVVTERRMSSLSLGWVCWFCRMYTAWVAGQGRGGVLKCEGCGEIEEGEVVFVRRAERVPKGVQVKRGKELAEEGTRKAEVGRGWW
jgi:hypothetical protein